MIYLKINVNLKYMLNASVINYELKLIAQMSQSDPYFSSYRD